ncbi:MAG: glycoside hydrolase family 37 [Clostridia bacterium]|nr:glycoside hydrolase family 37 [Clostridia bacterium]
MKYEELKKYCINLSKILWGEPSGLFEYPCIVVTKNSSYPCQLWDWGNWLNNIALRQIARHEGTQEKLLAYEQGSVMNFLNAQREDGSIDIVIASDPKHDLAPIMPHKNVHKPVIAQHVAFICKYTDDRAWLQSIYPRLEKFIAYYQNNAKHESGLFYFFDDFAIGVDNDPATFYRPDNSSASIFLNSLMYVELGAMAHLAKKLSDDKKAAYYQGLQDELKTAIQTHCYDEKDGLFYSCDINLRKIDKNTLLHSGAPRHYSTLIQRLGCWSSFLPLWAGIATPQQAERMVKENLLDEKAFWANYGVRSLSKYEKMYRIVGTGNPSSWQGGVWIVSNYFLFKGLLKYGYVKEGEELAKKTLDLLNQDYLKNGAFHEYYDPESGEGVFNKGFSSWNLLVFNMLAYFEGKEVVEEFSC